MTKLRDLIFENDESKTRTEPVPDAPPVIRYPLPVEPLVREVVTSVTNRFYGMLLQKTDPAQASTLQKILSLAKTLEPYIPERATRMRAAVAQAGGDVVAVSGEIQRLSELLKQEASSFHQELEQKKQTVMGKQAQADSMEKQLETLRDEISLASSKIKSSEDDFSVALHQREGELAQLAKESTTWR
jgi:uncharacterized protein YihD (DUF1040 family)